MGVVVVSVLIALGGLGALFGAAPRMSAGLSTLGILLDIGFALVMLYIAWGVFRLQAWAWTSALAVHVLSAGLAVLSLAGVGAYPGGWITLALAIGVIAYLTRPRVRAAFGGGSVPDRIL